MGTDDFLVSVYHAKLLCTMIIIYISLIKFTHLLPFLQSLQPLVALISSPRIFPPFHFPAYISKANFCGRSGAGTVDMLQVSLFSKAQEMFLALMSE